MQRRVIFLILGLSLVLTVLGGVSGILNRQSGSCSSDNDCSSRETFLFCINRFCQCLQGGSSYVHGVLLQFSMEWDPYRSKCVSQPGSPCTFKNRWYSSSDTTKLECSQDSSCIPHATSASNSQQQSRFQQQDYTMTENDFGVCWRNNQQGQGQNLGGGGGGGGSNVDSIGGHGQSPFYPILTPGHQQQHKPNRHEFAPHGNRGYPISPTKLDNSASGKYVNGNGIILVMFISFYSSFTWMIGTG